MILAGPGAAERDMASPLLAALPQAVDLCGALTLGEAAACIARCALYVGNDFGIDPPGGCDRDRRRSACAAPRCIAPRR